MQETDNKTQSNHQQQVQNPKENGTVIRLPKINMQVVVLGLVAVITIFQTFQLFSISRKVGLNSTPTTTSSSQGGGTGSNSDVPQSMVGGC